MAHRFLMSTAAAAVMAAFVCIAPVSLAGQSSAAASKPTRQAATRTPGAASFRTSDGQPDLQGIWSFATITPLERPKEFAGKEFLTPAEVAELEKRAATNNSQEEGEKDVAEGGVVNNRNLYNQIFWDWGSKVIGTRRTSLIIDPPDGRIPALSAEGQKRQAAFNGGGFGTKADSYTDRSLWERCITDISLPRLSKGYNNNVQIIQNRGYVILLYEQIHEPRIVPLDGRPHLPATVRLWLGDSRGHWEGDTLVIDTTNFSSNTNFRGSGANLHLVERLRRVDADTLDYQFTVEDPTTWARPWTADAPWKKTEGPLIEYSCHEGNYSMADVLGAARAAEKGTEGSERK